MYVRTLYFVQCNIQNNTYKNIHGGKVGVVCYVCELLSEYVMACRWGIEVSIRTG